MRIHWPVSVACEVLGVSVSGYFNWQSRQDARPSGPTGRLNNEALLATVGETVGAGTPVAQAGAFVGGRDAGVYFEVRHQGKAVDPATWIGR